MQPYEERLRELGFFCLEKAERESYKYLKGGRQAVGARLPSVVFSDGAKGNGHRLECRKFHVNLSKKLFTVRMAEHWNRLPCGGSFSGDI